MIVRVDSMETAVRYDYVILHNVALLYLYSMLYCVADYTCNAFKDVMKSLQIFVIYYNFLDVTNEM